MPTACVLPGCTTGYNSDRKLKKNNGEKIQSLFKPPKTTQWPVMIFENEMLDIHYINKLIEDFLVYLNEWEELVKPNNYSFISESTCTGLKVSLKATLEIARYLMTKCQFDFLITARLNQDSLEKFFSIMRSACGANDQPSSVQSF